MPKHLEIVIDTREQTPWQFPAKYMDYQVTTSRGCLQTADYSISGHEERGIIIERKAHWDEIAGNVTTGRERFRRELARMAPYSFRAIVICQPTSAIEMGQLRTRMSPQSLVGSVLGLCEEFGVFLWIVRDEAAGARYAMGAFRRYLEREARNGAKQ
jgi:DNA excision repair protein ERCC-4